MKKAVALLTTASLAASIFAFAGSASAAPELPSTAGQKLFTAGVIKGNHDGSLEETLTWEKQDLAVLLSRLAGKEVEAEATTKTHAFTDVEDEFYDGYISWAIAQNYLTGKNASTFGMDEVVSYRTLTAVLLRALGYDTTGANWFNAPQLAVDLGLIDAAADLDAPAVRGVAFGIILKALNTAKKDSQDTLATALNVQGLAGGVSAGETLKAMGLVKGDVDGNLEETAFWEKQDVTVLLSRLVGEEQAAEETTKTHTFADVEDEYYDGYISWAITKGYITGKKDGSFGMNEIVSYRTLAAVVLRALGYDTKGAKYFDTDALAVEVGLLPADTDFNAPAPRGVGFDIVVNALNAKVNGSDDLLGKTLKIQPYFYAVTGLEKVGTYNATYGIDDEFNFVVAVNPDNATNAEVTYTTSDAAIATVDATGKVKAIAAGTATITATTTEGNFSQSITFTVEEAATGAIYTDMMDSSAQSPMQISSNSYYSNIIDQQNNVQLPANQFGMRYIVMDQSNNSFYANGVTYSISDSNVAEVVRTAYDILDGTAGSSEAATVVVKIKATGTFSLTLTDPLTNAKYTAYFSVTLQP